MWWNGPCSSTNNQNAKRKVEQSCSCQPAAKVNNNSTATRAANTIDRATIRLGNHVSLFLLAWHIERICVAAAAAAAVDGPVGGGSNLMCVERSILPVGSTIGWLNKPFFGFVIRTMGRLPNVSSVNENKSWSIANTRYLKSSKISISCGDCFSVSWNNIRLLRQLLLYLYGAKLFGITSFNIKL